MAIATDIKYADLDELILDPLNPRLGRHNVSPELGQDRILEIIRGWGLEELAVSFAESGFWPQEALVVVRDGNIDTERFTVVEGNRRLAALKLLQTAGAGRPITRRWGELANEIDADRLFRKVPYILADSREDVRKFLGYRHVTGIKEWAPAEKARYISELVDSGMSYEEVMRSIGSKTPTVRRNYISYQILEQLDDVESVDTAVVEDRFSILFLALREHGVQAFLGVNVDAEPAEAKTPVSGAEYVENLEYFVKWVFGTREVPPLFSDSRYMTRFSRILENAEAVDYLKSARNPSVQVAATKAGADTDDLLEHLEYASDELGLALSSVHLYADRQEVKDAVDRLVKGFDALLNSFPELRKRICEEDRQASS